MRRVNDNTPFTRQGFERHLTESNSSVYIFKYAYTEVGALNLQDRKMTDRVAGVENAGLEVDGQKCSL